MAEPAVAPPGTAGTVDVRVTNLDGQSAAITNAFAYLSSIVTILSVSPATGLSMWSASPSGTGMAS